MPQQWIQHYSFPKYHNVSFQNKHWFISQCLCNLAQEPIADTYSTCLLKLSLITSHMFGCTRINYLLLVGILPAIFMVSFVDWVVGTFSSSSCMCFKSLSYCCRERHGMRLVSVDLSFLWRFDLFQFEGYPTRSQQSSHYVPLSCSVGIFCLSLLVSLFLALEVWNAMLSVEGF